MQGLAEFALEVFIVACGVIFVISVLSVFFQWLPKFKPASQFPTPANAKGGLMEVGRCYVVKLKDGEKIGPVEFEGHAMRRADFDDPTLENQISFKKRGGKRVIIDNFSVRYIEQVDAFEDDQPPSDPAAQVL